tara:strand:- start:1130 stop:3301 length:2172 start_codon:yes stop_codon:yes gene_type:complete
MYGYVRQPDGVLKPILLKNIKNIVVSGNSLDIVYFSVGTTPLEIPKVDQQFYFDNKEVKACSLVDPGALPEIYKNDIYTFGDTDFVNGDIKINFGDTPLDLYEVFTKWMNSILSGKVEATTDKTLNEYAPSLPVGYVFSNESSLPTAMIQKVAEGVEPCETEVTINDSTTVFVAADLVANSVPPIGTQVYEALFEDTTLTASLAPLPEDGTYILYQFIAPTTQVSGGGEPGSPALQPACSNPPGTTTITIYDNLLSQLDNIKYTVTIKDSAITSVTVCPETIQVSFSPIKEGKAFTSTSCGIPNGVFPQASNNTNAELCEIMNINCLANSDTYNSSEYWVRQESQDEFPGNEVFNKLGASIPFQDILSLQPTQFVTTANNLTNDTGSIIVPTTFSDSAYPRRIYSAVEDGSARPEFGLTGINMSILEIPNIPSEDPFGPPEIAGGFVMNGLPTAIGHTGGLYGLSSIAGNSIQDNSANNAPIFWEDGAPSDCILPNGQAANLSYQELTTPSGQTLRGRFLHRPNSTWGQIFSRDNNQPGAPGVPPGDPTNPPYFMRLQNYNVIPSGEPQFSGPSQLAHNVKVWFRDITTDPKTGIQSIGSWIEFRPSLNVATGLPFGMVNNIQNPGNPMSDPFNIPKDMMTIPFVIPETEKMLLDMGYTHRAFGVGSVAGFTLPSGSGSKEISYYKNKFRGFKYSENQNDFIGANPWSWEVIDNQIVPCGGEA